MAKTQRALTPDLAAFIEAQKIFFVATAPAEGPINLSPKGLESLRLMGSRRLLWLNLTGSGNETAAHVRQTPRMTLMFCAFEGDPRILRLYGQAQVIHPHDGQWEALYAHFPITHGARQIFDFSIEQVQVSCGMAVPLYEYHSDRQALLNWASRRGEAGLRDYWRTHNARSLAGLPTGVLDESMVLDADIQKIE